MPSLSQGEVAGSADEAAQVRSGGRGKYLSLVLKREAGRSAREKGD
jgi:hypothetical protein